MLFKLSLSNIRRSLRDYAIYFFTLIIGVSVFYVFNAIETQTAYLDVYNDTREMIDIMVKILSGVSVFVSVILGLLIVYASRFLMKRRSNEFALYMILGMSKGKISAILIVETVVIGAGSLVTGLAAGIGISQLMSALVVDLFEADMTSYSFTVSGDAIVKTIIYFSITYIVVMLFNSINIGRCKLIDLIQSGRRSEKLSLRDPRLCVILFLVSAVLLGIFYYEIGWNYDDLTGRKMLMYLVLMSAGTFLFFWSVSGLALRMAMKMKKFYYRGLNPFTFRQIASRVNTMVMSMTVICIMLFATICLLSVAFSARKTLNNGVKEFFPCDFEISFYNNTETGAQTCEEVFAEHGYDLDELFRDSVSVNTYKSDLKLRNVLVEDQIDPYIDELKYNIMVPFYGTPVYTVSDINAMNEFRGRKDRLISLGEDEYVILCNMPKLMPFFDKSMSGGFEVTVNGHTLKPAYDKCKDDFVIGSIERVNSCAVVVPDSVAAGMAVKWEHFWAWYDASTPKQRREKEEEFLSLYNDIFKEYDYTLRVDLTEEEKAQLMYDEENPDIYAGMLTKFQLADETIGIGAIATFLALYLGIVFLITCGAVLALKQLSESVDSMGRYTILRKIGADESDISKSLFRQTGLFFLLPMMLAIVHTAFGMRSARKILSFFIAKGFVGSMIFTASILLVIYGGYFLITYFCSKWIIKDKR